MTANILAYFHSATKAEDTARVLAAKGVPCLVDKVKKEYPNPDTSVSELMVGFLPDLAHGIFETGREQGKNGEESAFLLVLPEGNENTEELKSLLRRYGAYLIEDEKRGIICSDS